MYNLKTFEGFSLFGKKFDRYKVDSPKFQSEILYKSISQKELIRWAANHKFISFTKKEIKKIESYTKHENRCIDTYGYHCELNKKYYSGGKDKNIRIHKYDDEWYIVFRERWPHEDIYYICDQWDSLIQYLENEL